MLATLTRGRDERRSDSQIPSGGTNSRDKKTENQGFASTARGLASSAWTTASLIDTIARMFKSLLAALCLMGTLLAADLPSKKYLNLAAIKTMVAGAEAEAKRQNVSVTIVIVDENAALLFLEKGDGVSINTEEWAQKKARHAALYGSPSKEAADQVKSGNTAALSYPNFFPGQGGLPIKIDGQTIGAIAASGAKSEVDEAIAQAGIDALLKK